MTWMHNESTMCTYQFFFFFWSVIFHIYLGIAGQQSGNRASTTPLLVPPRIIDDPTNVTVLRNEPATLRCAFDGVPQPEVTWYREGEALEPRGHRLVLPDGALFFLRVTQSRGGGGRSGGGDAGTYWCVARNAAGQARSRNATLTVACKSQTSFGFLLFHYLLWMFDFPRKKKNVSPPIPGLYLTLICDSKIPQPLGSSIMQCHSGLYHLSHRSPPPPFFFKLNSNIIW